MCAFADGVVLESEIELVFSGTLFEMQWHIAIRDMVQEQA
jgi:hypothetical protein